VVLSAAVEDAAYRLPEKRKHKNGLYLVKENAQAKNQDNKTNRGWIKEL
jgi:hypothetical protein